MADQTNTADPSFMSTLQSTIQSTAQSMHISLEQAQQYVVKYLTGQAQLNSNVMGINDAFMWAAGFCVIGLVLSLFLRDVRKDKLRRKNKAQELTLLPAPKEAKES